MSVAWWTDKELRMLGHGDRSKVPNVRRTEWFTLVEQSLRPNCTSRKNMSWMGNCTWLLQCLMSWPVWILCMQLLLLAGVEHQHDRKLTNEGCSVTFLYIDISPIFPACISFSMLQKRDTKQSILNQRGYLFFIHPSPPLF